MMPYLRLCLGCLTTRVLATSKQARTHPPISVCQRALRLPAPIFHLIRHFTGCSSSSHKTCDFVILFGRHHPALFVSPRGFRTDFLFRVFLRVTFTSGFGLGFRLLDVFASQQFGFPCTWFKRCFDCTFLLPGLQGSPRHLVNPRTFSTRRLHGFWFQRTLHDHAHLQENNQVSLDKEPASPIHRAVSSTRSSSLFLDGSPSVSRHFAAPAVFVLTHLGHPFSRF
ncbi:hypothetical protein MRX96_042777 [Rhipicephalus microplus]